MKKKVAFNEVDNDVMITFWQINKDGNYTIERLKDKKVIQSLDFCDFQEAKTFYENLLLLENSTKDWVSIFKQIRNAILNMYNNAWINMYKFAFILHTSLEVTSHVYIIKCRC